MYLPPREIDGDIIVLGNKVEIFGSFEDHADCDDLDDRTAILGNLIIRGNNVVVRDVLVEGAVEITGNNVRVYDACSDSWHSD